MTWLSVAWGGYPLPPLLEARDPMAQASLQVAADGAPEGAAYAIRTVGGWGGWTEVHLVSPPAGEPPVVRVLRTYAFAEDGTLLHREEKRERLDLGRRELLPLPPAAAGAEAVTAARTALPLMGGAAVTLLDDEVEDRLAVVAPREGGWTVQLLRATALGALVVQLDERCEITAIDSGEARVPMSGAVYAAHAGALGRLETPRVARGGWTLEQEQLDLLLGPALSLGERTVQMGPGTPVRALDLVPALLTDRRRRTERVLLEGEELEVRIAARSRRITITRRTAALPPGSG